MLKRGLDADAIRAAAENPADLADLGLRYDLTVPLARFYASHRAELPTVFRAVQIAPVWRAERLEPNSYVRVGALGDGFQPVVHRGGRLDVETVDGPRRGRLHAGYATLDAVSLFGGPPS